MDDDASTGGSARREGRQPQDRAAQIADFLRSRRARISPEQAGLPADGRTRRVPGLRRDELARLAGVSTEYYTRLEQGRSGTPSADVIAGLADALRLDASEREHLGNLFSTRRPPAPKAPQRVRSGLYLTLQALEHVPALVLGRRTDVLASNHLARTVLTDFEALPVRQRNLARYYLLDPEARARVGDWEQVAAETVANLRLEAGRCPGDRQLADLIGELTVKSPEFSRWWADHRVLSRTHGTKRLIHPLVGELHFDYESFAVPDDPNQTLCIYNVEPASPTAGALRLLGGWSTPWSESEQNTHAATPPTANG